MICKGKRWNKMPTISKIRFTNVVYDGGNKRYADELFHFHGENGAIVLENGGGKTVFIQTALQAIIPHVSLANRKVKDTYNFDDGPVHIAIEWIKNDRPRIYALTAITIFPYQNGIDSYRYVYEYGPNDPNSIEHLPFSIPLGQGKKRIASHTEMKDYYGEMSHKSQSAHTFSTISGFTEYIEKNFQIIADEWKSICTINSAEGDVEKFFEACTTEKALYEKLLIPTVEQSIADFDKYRFVDIFEQQRDKFKLLKQLNAQLKEYDVIQKELSNYVDVTKTFHEYEEQYEAEKQKGKAYSELLSKFINDNQGKIDQLFEQQQKLEKQFDLLSVKQKSYEIAVMEQKLQELESTYKELVIEHDSIQTKLNNQKLYFGNVKYANYNRLLKKAEEQLNQYEKELQQLDETFSTDELLDQLDEVKAKIRGNFLSEKERYTQQKEKVEQEKRQKETVLDEQRKLIKDLSRKQLQLYTLITELKTEIKMNEEQAENISNDLFEDDVQRSQPILELRTAWIQESQKLDEQIVDLKNNEKNLHLQKQKHENRLNEITNELIYLKGQETKVSQKIKSIEETENNLRADLITVLPRVSENTSLYLKEASLIQELTKAWEKKERIFEEKLHEERLAFRYVDDYGEQQSFFADPYIAKKLPVWSQRFSYLETAIEYAMGDELPVERELLAITLITTEEEKENLEQLVIDSAKDLTYPIQIWTLSEVIAISRGERAPQTNFVQPELWQQLSDVEAFQQWQKEAEQVAQNRKQEREVADGERTRLKEILSKLKNFYEEYPFANYQKLTEHLNQLKRATYEVTNEQKALVQEIEEIEGTLGKIRNNIIDKTELKKYYDKKIELLIQYEKLKNEIVRLEQELATEQQQHENISKQLIKEQDLEQALVEEINDLLSRIHEIEGKYKEIVAERYLYKQVTTFAPKYTDESYEGLEQQYTHIDNQIKGINSSRYHIEQLIKQQENHIKGLKNQRNQLKIEYSELDEQFELPLDFEQQLQQLPTEINNLEGQLATLSKKRNKAKEEKDKQEGAHNLKRKEVEEPIQFELPLPTVKIQLKDEEGRLNLQQKLINKTKVNLLKAKSELEKVEKDIQILNGEHHFLAPDVITMTLTTDEESDFSYRKEHFINLLRNRLTDLKGSKDRYLDVVKNRKQEFLQFCSQNVSEARLRNTIIDGIKVKDNYEDLVKHQQEMEKTIHMSRQYVERDIKKHDEQLIEFVNRVHKHLRKVVEELKHIPRKTKVNVDGEDVFIYRFNIPEWNDEEGIAQIKARIDWIMDQLEQIETRTVDEQESKQKTRKQLEEWLSTVQLLRYITQNKEWRVSCRKVMNDNRISKHFETWSRSNAWSGGEKWSKNMALFLGVLNYVAEKRQYISSKKKSRTVILDNPFGKASSDHVLSPVFFIAKLLGFQIIALTAHVEGKFLHDYFPVVYSCRLRTAVGTDKLVMETKTMHQAYFRDHNEEAEEVIQFDQLSLFDE